MKILIACGGTGGHIFPGIALAEEFSILCPDAEIVFVGTTRGLEQRIFSGSKWRLELIEAVSFADKSGFEKITSLFPFLVSFLRTRSLILKENPDLILGVGGYASAPVLIAGRLSGKNCYAIEPNAIPGLSNRLATYFVKEVFVAFDGMEKYFGRKAIKTGVPIRRSIKSRADHFKDLSKKTVLIFGGSQGAKAINENVLKALNHLGDLKETVTWIHQIGSFANLAEVEAEYARLGFQAEVYPFINDMATVYDKADFCISRSGANSVAELLFLQKPCLLIPYPNSASNHQEANAKQMADLGIAKMLQEKELTPEKLASMLREILTTPTSLSKMKTAFGPQKREFAAEVIAKRMLA